MLKVLIIFGGKSSEHGISCLSTANVLENIDKEKYDVTTVGIDKLGNWYEYVGEIKNIKAGNWYEYESSLIKVNNIYEFIANYDLAYPILHGKFGEDGTIQGMFEMIGIDFVGCNSETSAIGMDKHISKILANSANIPIVPFQIVSNVEDVENIEVKFDYPVIVKPNDSGSSYGVTKVNDKTELKTALKFAFDYGNKVLIEQYIPAREIECAILGNKDYIVADVGEIVAANEFYDFESKYEPGKSICKIPADVEQNNQIKEYAKRFCTLIGVRGISRIDFFISKADGSVYLNEINTMPGFTNSSMYPKLMENMGISYKELINRLIELAMEK